jgi:hypothetical protein
MPFCFSCHVAPAFGRPLGASNPGAASLLVSETPEWPRQVAEAARWTPYQGEAAWRRPPGEDHIQRPLNSHAEPRGPTEGRRPSEAGPRGLSVEPRREEVEGRRREGERGTGGIGQEREREATAALQELKYLRPRQADPATTQTGQTTERQVSHQTDRSATIQTGHQPNRQVSHHTVRSITIQTMRQTGQPPYRQASHHTDRSATRQTDNQTSYR